MEHTFQLKQGCVFSPFDTGRDSREFVLRTPAGRLYRVSGLVKDVLERLDGRSTLTEVFLRLDVPLDPQSFSRVAALIEEHYLPLGILESRQGDGRSGVDAVGASLQLPLLLRWQLVPQSIVSGISPVLALAFSRYGAILGLAAIAAAHFLVYVSYRDVDFFPLSANPLGVVALIVLAGLCHEFGHASALARFGGAPGSIGMGLYALLPVFWSDVTGTWELRRKQRCAVDAGGVYFGWLASSVYAALGILTLRREFITAFIIVDVMALINLNPIFRFDGYWLLVDYLAVPDLHRRALRRLWARLKRMQLPPLPALRGRQRVVFELYSVAAALFLVVLAGLIYRTVWAPVAAFPTTALGLFNRFTQAYQAHNYGACSYVMLSALIYLAIPVSFCLGLARYAYALISGRLARRSDGRAKHYS